MSSSRPIAGIATPHPAAAAAGRAMLLRGGNAVDAAVAAMLACCVVEPAMVGLGGYGGSLVAHLDGRSVAIDFDSRAPLAYRPELFGDGRKNYDSGYLSITVPAVVAGLDLALSRFGTMAWATVSEAAISYAENGVAVSAELNRQLHGWAAKADPFSKQSLLPDGTVPGIGSIWKQPDLARLMARLAADGPAMFYRGDIPQTIVRQVRQNGGILTDDDFANYQPTIVEPLAIEYRGYRVLTPPPPSGGITSLSILSELAKRDLTNVAPWSANYFHLVAEATKPAWDFRSRPVGDPGSMPSPHTVNISAADAAGNLVSITATQGNQFGSAVVIDGLGLIMNHGMSRFDLTSGSPNAPAAGKRMVHNMAPTILLKDGRPFAALGLPGGPKILTVTAQLVASLVDFGATPEQAVNAGRIHAAPGEPLAVSSAVSDEVIAELRRLGHTVRRGQDAGGPPNEIGGPANVVAINSATGSVSVASQARDGATITLGCGSRD